MDTWISDKRGGPTEPKADKQAKAKTAQGKPRQRHSEEFKAGAVRLVVDEERSVSEVGRDLGIHRSLVDTWVCQARTDSGKGRPGALTSPEKEELARLRRENKILKMERATLVIAAAFFAKENA